MKANHEALAKCVQKRHSAGRCESRSHAALAYYVSSCGNNPTSQSAGAKGLYSHVRFLGPIALVVYCRRDAHHQRGEAVATQIVVLFAGVLALKDLHQHEIELNALQTHPGEGGQEEEMQKASKDGTGDLKTAARDRGERKGKWKKENRCEGFKSLLSGKQEHRVWTKEK